VSRSLVVADTTPPVFDHLVQEAVQFECGEVPEPCVVTATDNSGAEITVTLSTHTVSSTETIHTYSASDCAGNTVTQQQTVTTVDTTKPVLTRQPSDTTVTCDCGAFPEPKLFSVDNCDEGRLNATLSTTYSWNTATQNLATLTFPVSQYNTWSATDTAGNTFTHDQTVTIVDEEAPEIIFNGEVVNTFIVPPAPVLGCAASAKFQQLLEQGVVVIDNCDTTPERQHSQEFTKSPNQSCAHKGTWSVTFSASDNSNAAVSKGSTWMMHDELAPYFSNPSHAVALDKIDCSASDLKATIKSRLRNVLTDDCDGTMLSPNTGEFNIDSVDVDNQVYTGYVKDTCGNKLDLFKRPYVCL